jgi:hypothetical protein
VTWFRIDDGFWSHPKIVGLSDSAVALWVRAGAYACQHLTDGFLPAQVLRMVGERDAAAELVEAGLWDEAPGGYQFHDWSEYQETSSTVKERRAAARERQRKSRAAREAKKPQPQADSEDSAPDVTPDVTRDNTCEFSTPDPTRPIEVVTDVTTSEESASRKRSAVPRTDRGQRLPEGWRPSDQTIAKMREEAPQVDLRHEHAKFADYWRAQPGAKGRKTDWDATWRNWIRRVADQTKPTRPSAATEPDSVPRGDRKVLDTFNRGE